jgi:cytosine/adenosine deaminase-related metal-dependent hydrolase
MHLISPVTAVTMDAQRRIITDAAIAVEGPCIAAVGKAADLLAHYPGAERLDGRGMLALPGLIDAHVHSDQAILRSFADDLPWQPYLFERVFPLLKHRTTADAATSLKLCMLEMIRSGTTSFVDCMVHSRYDFDLLAETAAGMGLRVTLAKYAMPQAAIQGSQSIDAGTVGSEDESLAAIERAISDWHGAAEGRIQVWFGPLVPRDPQTCSPDFYQAVAERAAALNSGITMHLGAEREDIPFFADNFNMRPAEFARTHGLTGPNVLLINGCHFNEAEVEILAETGTSLAHSPTANMKMASGVARVPEMRARGVAVALGTDAGANNNCHDMVREMKAAALLHNITRMDAAALTAEDVIEMATIEGARAIGRADEIGSLKAGKQADLILVDLHKPHTIPVHDPLANLVYAAHGGDVDTVMVAGKVLMRGRQLVGIDEAAILTEAQAVGVDLLTRAGMSVDPGWPVE